MPAARNTIQHMTVNDLNVAVVNAAALVLAVA
jgi:hypothetical protein